MWSRSLPLWLTNLLVAAGYFGAAKIGLHLAVLHPVVSLVWPATGIAMAAMFVLGYRIWPGIMAGAFLANVNTIAWPTAFGISIGNVLEALLGTFLVNRYVGTWCIFNRVQDMLKFVLLAGLLSPMASATIGVLSLGLAGDASWAAVPLLWSSWWLGDVMGAIVVTPLLLSLSEPWSFSWQPRRFLNATLLTLLLLTISLAVFGPWQPTDRSQSPQEFLLIPLFIWAAYAFGYRGLTLTIAMVAGIAIWGTINGFGPFASASPIASLFLLQGFLGVCTVTFMLMASVVNERKQAAEALQEALTEAEDLYQNAPCGYHSLDPVGRFVRVNATELKWLGYSRDELLGKPFADLLPPAGQAFFRQNFPGFKERGQILDLEYELIRKDGTILPVLLNATAQMDAAGRFVMSRSMIVDISERKRAIEEAALRTAELREANKLNRLKDNLLSTISHEMKTPLSLIVGYTEMLEATCPDETLIDGILDGCRRLTDHLNRMLDYSSLVSGTLSLYKTEVNFAELAQNVRAMLEREFHQKGVTLEIEVHPDARLDQADSRRVTQMLLELLGNALKFTPSGGSAGLRVTPFDGEVRMDVWDTGEGMAKPELDRIWSALTQLEADDASRTGGLGLGLSIVKMLVERHGGRIEVQSQLNQGSQFSIFLPVSPANHPHERAA